MKLQHYFRIGISETALATGWFVALRLPIPEVAFYQSYSIRRPQGLGGEGRHRYHTAFLQWDELGMVAASYVKGLILQLEATAGTGNAVLFLTVPRTDASYAGSPWIDISGKVKMPEWKIEPWTQGKKYVSPTLSLNNVTIVNEPSTAL